MAPIMPSGANIKSIESSVATLNLPYQLSFADPLSIKEIRRMSFLMQWQKRIELMIEKGTRTFIGFSFGAVILKHVLAHAPDDNLKLIMVSPPSPLKGLLHERLSLVRALCQKGQVLEALHQLYDDVYAPKNKPSNLFYELDLSTAQSRLIQGFNLLFDLECSSSLPICPNHKILSLIGAQSQLVTRAQGVASETNESVVTVPNAGMRVLENNLPFCLQTINSFLEG